METYDIRTGEAIAVDAPRPRLTCYPVPKPAAPAILVLPGGGYAGQAPHESEPIAQWLNGLGIAAFVLDYRVAPERHPAPLQDARAGLRFIREHGGVDSDRVGVLGFSAGGHLAATLSVGTVTADDEQPPRPDLAVLCYPVISFVEWTETGSMRNLLGPDPAQADRELLSPERHVDSRTPPTFLWHTADDEAVAVGNSLLYAKNLSAHSVPFELHVFPHGKHGLGLAGDDPAVSRWSLLCGAWLEEQGWVGN